MRIKVGVNTKIKLYMLVMTWMSQNQRIRMEIFSIVVCSLLPFPENKDHEKSKDDKFKLLAPQSIYAPQSHPCIHI
jgi:hypothetical protein